LSFFLSVTSKGVTIAVSLIFGKLLPAIIKGIAVNATGWNLHPVDLKFIVALGPLNDVEPELLTVLAGEFKLGGGDARRALAGPVARE